MIEFVISLNATLHEKPSYKIPMLHINKYDYPQNDRPAFGVYYGVSGVVLMYLVEFAQTFRQEVEL